MDDYHQSYNARNLTPEEIAEFLVVPDDAREIFQFKHHILLGPRGVGKTTLLKVLTARGLYAISKRENPPDGLDPANIDFLPVYIPADTLWKGSVGYFTDVIPNAKHRDHILNGLFVNHCLRELIIALEGACEVGKKLEPDQNFQWALNLTIEQEEQISRLCSDAWKLEKIQTSFLGLKLAILDRLNLYRSAINALDVSGALKTALTITPLDITIVLKTLIEIMEGVTGTRKWVFSFDEMEIAPRRVVSLLYENIRSFDSRAALKFSLYPYLDFYDSHELANTANAGPVADQDFKPISLTNKFANPNPQFATRLIDMECRKRGVQFHEFRNYLNSSKSIRKGTRIFRDNSTKRDFPVIFATILKRKEDPSLISHIEKSGLNSRKRISEFDEDQMASKVRKIAPHAEFRSYYFTHFERDGLKVSRRSSFKSFSYYHGFEQLPLITEGNPRAILHYVNELIDGMRRGVDSHVAQNRSVGRNLDRFRALVATQAIQPGIAEGLRENALDLVDAIGELLVRGLLARDFIAHPALSVTFKNVRPETRKLLAIAVNAGALVADTDATDHQKILFDIEGVRLRVSYRLVQYYPLPTITGRQRVLTTHPARAIEDAQPDLTGWDLGDD